MTLLEGEVVGVAVCSIISTRSSPILIDDRSIETFSRDVTFDATAFSIMTFAREMSITELVNVSLNVS